MIGFVQTKGGTVTDNSQSIVFDSDVTIGSLIRVDIRESVGTGTLDPTVTSTRSAALTKVRQQANGGDNKATALMYWAIATSTGPCTVSIVGASGIGVRARIYEYSGNWGTSPIDLSNSNSGGYVGTLTTPSLTPSKADALIAVMCIENGDATSFGISSPWNLASTVVNRLSSAYQIVSSSSAYSATYTWSSSSNGSATIIASFVEDDGGGVAHPLVNTSGNIGPSLVNGGLVS